MLYTQCSALQSHDIQPHTHKCQARRPSSVLIDKISFKRLASTVLDTTYVWVSLSLTCEQAHLPPNLHPLLQSGAEFSRVHAWHAEYTPISLSIAHVHVPVHAPYILAVQFQPQSQLSSNPASSCCWIFFCTFCS
mmetsp:Transcript_8072/g.21848  ORF Transcript_8072/g.21848 Transcript_8072/m.21848 type:complete len:135 (-) Transcript_8072:196-600(-)